VSIIEKLKRLKLVGSIAVMPDFFVDRIVRLESKEALCEAINEKAKSGGGSIRGIPTSDFKGGNAVNVAYALAKLGAKVTLFTVANDIGAEMISRSFSRFKDRVSLRISEGKHGYTTSFEFPHQGTRVNVMVSDILDNADFGPERIREEADRALIKNADGVIVANWATNEKGTELAEYVFANSPSAFHMLDPADVQTRKREFYESLVSLSGKIDCLSINENECRLLAQTAGLSNSLGEVFAPDEVVSAAKSLSEKVGISIDLHTKIGAAWSNGKEAEFVHSVKVEAKMLTGAGDVWDAADMLGYLAGLDARERLLFSNCTASLYIRDTLGEPPSLEQVFEIVERIQ
jgi:ribokinase